MPDRAAAVRRAAAAGERSPGRRHFSAPVPAGSQRSAHFRSSRSFRTPLAIAGGRSPRGKTLVPETLVVGWRCAKKACVVLMMPILCS